MPDPLFIVDEEGTILFLFGGEDSTLYFGNKNFVGRNLRELILNEETYNALITGIKNALKSDTMEIVEISGAAEEVSNTVDKVPEGRQWYEARIKRIPQPIKGKSAVAVISVNITSRKLLEMQLKKLSETDPLTGAYNRRYFIEQIDRQHKYFIRYGAPVSLIMFDLDYFKKINDTYGHTTGDEVLKHFVKICSENFREADIFARYGGEEFVGLLPNSTSEGAYRIAERIRKTIEKAELNIKGNRVKYTVSGGIADMKKGDHSYNDALNRADEALYKAKNSGRNRIVIYK